MGDRVVRVARLGLVAGVCIVALALLPSLSAAAVDTYYASPTGDDPDACTQGDPCSIDKAVSLTGDGDSVSLEAGEYSLPFAGLKIEKEIDFGAQPGAMAVLATDSSAKVEVTVSADATLHDLRLEGEGGLELGSGTAQRIFVAFVGVTADACALGKGTTLKDSVCWTLETNEEFEGESHALAISSSGTGLDEPVVLRNVTAVASNADGDGIHALAAAGAILKVDAANVIASAENGADIVAEKLGGGNPEALVTVSHSLFSSFVDDPSSAVVTPPGTNGNVSAAPSFVDLGSGDFHLNPGSAALDGGIADSSVSTLDLDGTARAQAKCFGTSAVPDMGAYERAPTDPCPPPPPPPPPPLDPRKPVFRVIKLTLNKRLGSGLLQMEVPSAGTLSLAGQGIKLVRRRSAAPGDLVNLPIQPWAITRVRLKKTGKSRVKLKLVFEPQRGPPNVLSMGILLRKTRR